MPTAEEMRAIADAYVDAYNRNDKDAVLALFHDDATFEDPVGTPVRVGREAIGAFWDETHGLATIELERKQVIVCGNEMVLVFAVHTTFGDSTMDLDVVDLLLVGDDGRVRALKAYWDMPRN
jgi:steroid delta-isomerase